MSEWDTAALAAADKRYVWHPFTPMGEWCASEHEPIVLVRGEGALLWDSNGREYIDGNASIWTNIHGHNHPHINAAIRRQLERVAHTSFLGFTNPPAIELARAVVDLFPAGTLSRVFYSDDGSTGIEVALRIVAQFWSINGDSRPDFVAFKSGYHGDTAGAASLGAAAMFQKNGSRWSFPVRQVGSVAQLEALDSEDQAKIAAVVIEPLVQGAAGIRLWPSGTLSGLRRWCDRSGCLLIADEVLTGFGRTGRMFACEQEGVTPDIMVLGKGLTGGYLPLAITLITDQIFKAFSSSETDPEILFYGHSYAGNALGCAAALASLELFEIEQTLAALSDKICHFSAELNRLKAHPAVAEIRQCGLMAGIELRADRSKRIGAEVCLAARAHGLLTRPIGNTVVLMPPLCVAPSQINRAVAAVRNAIDEVCCAARR